MFFCLKKYSLDSLAIATAAMEMLGGKEALASCRTDQIMADAAYVVLTRDSRARTGEFLVDEDVLIEVGVTDFEPYACVPGMSSGEDRVTGLLDLGWVVGKINVKKGGMFTLKNFPEPCLLTNWFDALCS